MTHTHTNTQEHSKDEKINQAKKCIQAQKTVWAWKFAPASVENHSKIVGKKIGDKLKTAQNQNM